MPLWAPIHYLCFAFLCWYIVACRALQKALTCAGKVQTYNNQPTIGQDPHVSSTRLLKVLFRWFYGWASNLLKLSCPLLRTLNDDWWWRQFDSYFSVTQQFNEREAGLKGRLKNHFPITFKRMNQTAGSEFVLASEPTQAARSNLVSRSNAPLF